MKVLKLIFFGLMLTLAGSVTSQLRVRVNIGTPPAWGPSGYDDVRYYYLPDVEAYYDVQNSMFIYISGNRWVHRSYLPSLYRNYDLYGGYKVVMNDYRGNSPYSHFREHKMKYEKGYRGEEQENNRDWDRDHNYKEKRHNDHHSRMDYRPNQQQERNNFPNPQYRERNNDRNQGRENDNNQGHGKEKGKKNHED